MCNKCRQAWRKYKRAEAKARAKRQNLEKIALDRYIFAEEIAMDEYLVVETANHPEE